MRRLEGKTAVITGGSSGIGLATARAFIDEGARVLITGTGETRLQAAAAGLGPNAQSVVADVRRLGDLDALAAAAGSAFGSLDILFANAGVGQFAAIESCDEALYDDIFDTNVKGLFFTVQKLLPLLSPSASIILTSSAANAKGVATGSVYAATKAAIRSLARSLAAELATRGIRVNSLSPGYVPTRFFERSGASDDVRAGFESAIAAAAPLHRVGRPEEIARAAVFLAGDDSSYVTATDLVVDGGWMNV